MDARKEPIETQCQDCKLMESRYYGFCEDCAIHRYIHKNLPGFEIPDFVKASKISGWEGKREIAFKCYQSSRSESGVVVKK